tara:strand:- start:3207 stop:3362 length:156 start_codon:yes stop_codon:yes gene_type:complete
MISKKIIIDLTGLSGISENFHDHIHPTKFESEIIAERTSKSLENEIKYTMD